MKKTLFLLFAVVAFIFQNCSEKTDKDSQTSITSEDTSEVSAADEPSLDPSLTMQWETDTTLTTVESLLFDASENIIYASCIAGNPTNKDGIGYISKLSRNGEIIVLEWANGLNAPKGMGILNNHLYVTDIDRLVEIDLASGEISKTYSVEGASFLNDVATDGSSIYFSDMATGKIHKLEAGVVSTVISSRENVNGLAIDKDGNLYALDASGLVRFDGEGNSTIINHVVTNGDGLVVIDENTFLASRWDGEIYLISDKREYLLLDTKAQSSNTADIGFIPEANIILVPAFFKNKAIAYRLNY